MCQTEDCKLRAIDRKASVFVSRLDGSQLKLEVDVLADAPAGITTRTFAGQNYKSSVK